MADDKLPTTPTDQDLSKASGPGINPSEKMNSSGLAADPTTPEFAAYVNSLDKNNLFSRAENDVTRLILRSPRARIPEYAESLYRGQQFDYRRLIATARDKGRATQETTDNVSPVQAPSNKPSDHLLFQVGATAAMGTYQFQRSTQFNYMRKMLALSYRHAQSLEQIADTSSQVGKMLEAKLEAIKINTAAPESRKSSLLSRFREEFRVQAIRNAVTNVRETVGGFVKPYLKQRVGSPVASGYRQFASGEKDLTDVSGAIRDQLARILGRTADKTKSFTRARSETTATAGSKAADILSSLSDRVQSASVSESLRDKARNISRFIRDHLPRTGQPDPGVAGAYSAAQPRSTQSSETQASSQDTPRGAAPDHLRDAFSNIPLNDSTGLFAEFFQKSYTYHDRSLGYLERIADHLEECGCGGGDGLASRRRTDRVNRAKPAARSNRAQRGVRGAAPRRTPSSAQTTPISDEVLPHTEESDTRAPLRDSSVIRVTPPPQFTRYPSRSASPAETHGVTDVDYENVEPEESTEYNNVPAVYTRYAKRTADSKKPTILSNLRGWINRARARRQNRNRVEPEELHPLENFTALPYYGERPVDVHVEEPSSHRNTRRRSPYSSLYTAFRRKARRAWSRAKQAHQGINEASEQVFGDAGDDFMSTVRDRARYTREAFSRTWRNRRSRKTNRLMGDVSGPVIDAHDEFDPTGRNRFFDQTWHRINDILKRRETPKAKDVGDTGNPIFGQMLSSLRNISEKLSPKRKRERENDYAHDSKRHLLKSPLQEHAGSHRENTKHPDDGDGKPGIVGGILNKITDKISDKLFGGDRSLWERFTNQSQPSRPAQVKKRAKIERLNRGAGRAIKLGSRGARAIGGTVLRGAMTGSDVALKLGGGALAGGAERLTTAILGRGITGRVASKMVGGGIGGATGLARFGVRNGLRAAGLLGRGALGLAGGSAGGALSLATRGPGVLLRGIRAAVSPLALGGMGISFLTNRFTKEGSVANKAGTILGSTATYAGLGSMFGPWGTAAGAGVGALIGIYKTLAGNKAKVDRNGNVIPDKQTGISSSIGKALTISSAQAAEPTDAYKAAAAKAGTAAPYVAPPASPTGNYQAAADVATGGGNASPATGGTAPVVDAQNISDQKEYKATLSKLNPDITARIQQSDALKFAVWSTAVQMGPEKAATMVTQEYNPGGTDREFIRKLFQVRTTQFVDQSPQNRVKAISQISRQEDYANAVDSGTTKLSYSGAAQAAGVPVQPMGDARMAYIPHPKVTSAETKKLAAQGIDFLAKKGWTREQATGIIANLIQESRLDTAAVGDGGRAVGLAQWHPDRQAAIQRQFKVESVRNLDFFGQLAAVDWELRNTEKGAGNALAKATDANTAAQIISRQYERPGLTDAVKAQEAVNRGAIASNLMTSTPPVQAPGAQTTGTPAGASASQPTTGGTSTQPTSTQAPPSTALASTDAGKRVESGVQSDAKQTLNPTTPDSTGGSPANPPRSVLAQHPEQSSSTIQSIRPKASITSELASADPMSLSIPIDHEHMSEAFTAGMAGHTTDLLGALNNINDTLKIISTHTATSADNSKTPGGNTYVQNNQTTHASPASNPRNDMNTQRVGSRSGVA